MVSSVCADASRTNLLPLSSSRCSGTPVSSNMVPSSRTTVSRLSLSTELTNWSSSTSRSASSTGSDSAVPSIVPPASTYGPLSSGRLEVEVLLADGRQVVDVHRRVRGQLGAVLEREVEGDALGGRLHLRDLADLHAAVGDLAALEQAARAGQRGLHGDPAPEHAVDQAEVGAGDVDDADRAQHEERADPDPYAAGHDGASVESARTGCGARRGRRRRRGRRAARRGPAGPAARGWSGRSACRRRRSATTLMSTQTGLALYSGFLQSARSCLSRFSESSTLAQAALVRSPLLQALLDLGEHLAGVGQAGDAAAGIAVRDDVLEVDVGADRGVGVVALDDVAGLLREREAHQQVEAGGERVAGLVQLWQDRLEVVERGEDVVLALADHPGPDLAELVERGRASRSARRAARRARRRPARRRRARR